MIYKKFIQHGEIDLDTIYVKDREDKRLFVRVWKPTNAEPLAVLQIIHGMSEHSGRYSHVARFFSERGFIVVAHDHRGHGHTDPDYLGYLDHEKGLNILAENIGDIKRKITEDYPDLPFIMLGHSMGSFCLQQYFQLFDDKNTSAIIYSGSNGKLPLMLNLGIWMSSFQRKLYGDEARSQILERLVAGSYNRQFKPNRTTADWLSRDEQMVDLYLDDPLCNFVFTNRFFYALFTGLKEMHHRKPFAGHDKNIPVLLVSGDLDPVSNKGKGVLNLAKIIKNSGIRQVDKKLYPGGRHEMLNEINRDEVLADLHKWIQSNAL